MRRRAVLSAEEEVVAMADVKKKKKINKDKNNYSPEVVKKRRVLPKKNIALLILLLAIQITGVVLASLYEPKPIDVIEEYNVTVDIDETSGYMTIEYDILWRALSESESLEWVDIGLANEYCTLLTDSLSDSVAGAEIYTDEDYVAARLYFKESYLAGETVRFKFTVEQREMLVDGGDGYFYELVPGWFNEIPVEHYRFSWEYDSDITYIGGDPELVEDRYVWEGSLEPGGYVPLRVEYDYRVFGEGVDTVGYEPFDGDGAYNSLEGDKYAVWAVAALVIILVGIGEVYIIDSFVSYGRGRGFIREYGHPIHAYGAVNPAYRAAMLTASANQSLGAGIGRGGMGGHSCACACACACAGGGRAGCSQKDGVDIKQLKKVKKLDTGSH